jgi:diadenosine tetraphosphate (Ap4A) HIT family hydrolase|tara:strand:+ start:8675 stop:9097 length:423 start_codon:yes stop_codon:yes gene_type:complete
LNATFELHPRLDADTTLICDLALSRVLLMRDARYPWLILVPRRANLRELHQLQDEDLGQVMQEIAWVSDRLSELTQAFKLNVAALGNQVPQLHIHIIARQQNDAAWPNPVWGIGDPLPYDDNELAVLCTALEGSLQGANT